ncbi:Dimer-Tnp-hAT domain-containing protein [Mycena venus]|uniref:Dimer-Tnp-hAT domain-containing protein n=1 Tax=Mycena venus TaxID=2733690 RepID=A0A8H6Z8B6_9AGAR|nr:Dimer-Tnp-hAT domain-containing protein [Mycena venus]
MLCYALHLLHDVVQGHDSLSATITRGQSRAQCELVDVNIRKHLHRYVPANHCLQGNQAAYQMSLPGHLHHVLLLSKHHRQLVTTVFLQLLTPTAPEIYLTRILMTGELRLGGMCGLQMRRNLLTYRHWRLLQVPLTRRQINRQHSRPLHVVPGLVVCPDRGHTVHLVPVVVLVVPHHLVPSVLSKPLRVQPKLGVPVHQEPSVMPHGPTPSIPLQIQPNILLRQGPAHHLLLMFGHSTAFAFGLNTSTGVLRRHLFEHHANEWIAGCDRLKIPIKAKDAQPAVEKYRRRQGQQFNALGTSSRTKGRRPYSHEAFVDAIVEFVVGDDQSINVIENESLRAIFLMLREDLQDSDIPHRSTIRNRIMQLFEEHLDRVASDIANAIGKLSTTMDIWTDQRRRPFMAVTGHWIETTVVETPSGPRYALKLRSALIGFIQVPGHHDGEHLAHAFLHVIDRIGAAKKLGWDTLDNASNNDTFMLWVEILLRRRAIPYSKTERRIR